MNPATHCAGCGGVLSDPPGSFEGCVCHLRKRVVVRQPDGTYRFDRRSVYAQDMERRYCQRCSTPTQVAEGESPKPCRHCGGVNFDVNPPSHFVKSFRLTPEDKKFLKVNRIKDDW